MGLAGVGKTTVARELVDKLRIVGTPVVWIDGDEIRKRFSLIGHDRKARDEAGLFYLRLADLLSDNGINVVISSIGMSKKFETIGKNMVKNYFQVLLTAELDLVKERSRREFYLNGDTNVVGIDLAIDDLQYDLIIQNGELAEISNLASQIMERLDLK